MPIERPSDREYPCFLCTQGKAKDKFSDCPACGAPLDIGPLLEKQDVDQYHLEVHVGRGFYGATFRALNRIGKPFALKLVPYSLYEIHDKSFDEEIARYLKLGSHPNIAELIDAGSVSLSAKGRNISFYYVVMEWIEGISLTEYLKKGPPPPNEIIGAIFDVSMALERFEAENLWHNDLNSDNILFKKLTQEEQATRKIGSAYTCKIIDIGSAVFRQGRLPGRLADLTFLGMHISDLVQAALVEEGNLTREDQFLLHELEKVVARLLDEDPARGFHTAGDLLARVSDLYQQRFLLTETVGVTLSDPFVYLNANDFPNDAYINYLFSGLLPWIEDVVAPEAQGTLITGPRGSGKTMILRSMRLKTRLHSSHSEESNAQIYSRLLKETQIAFFVSARIEIGNHCSMTKLPKWASSEELVTYYFLLLYAFEVLDTLFYGTSKKILKIDSRSETFFCHRLSSSLGFSPLFGFSELLREIRATQYSFERERAPAVPHGAVLTSQFFSGLAEALRSLAPAFANKGVTFLLDDFSTPKVPATIQKVLLPLIWNSGGGYSFRVSAHSESVSAYDVRGNRYQVNRDYREINLGAAYLNSVDVVRQETAIEAYVSDIFTRRFNITEKYKGYVLRDLLGPDYKGSIARDLKRLNSDSKLRTWRYYGFNTLIKLCSGDISYLIDMLGNMLRQNETLPIATMRQHHAIKQYAWKELYRLHDDTPTATCNLYELALNFGKLSLFKLLGKSVKEGDGERPAEYLRIEVAVDDQLDELHRVVAELLQNGVFVDGGFSNSSKGIPARRLLFRKIFTPAFPTTYNSRDTFPMTARRFLDFSKNPERFVRSMLGEEGIKPDEQVSFLDGLVDPIE